MSPVAEEPICSSMMLLAFIAVSVLGTSSTTLSARSNTLPRRLFTSRIAAGVASSLSDPIVRMVAVVKVFFVSSGTSTLPSRDMSRGDPAFKPVVMDTPASSSVCTASPRAVPGCVKRASGPSSALCVPWRSALVANGVPRAAANLAGPSISVPSVIWPAVSLAKAGNRVVRADRAGAAASCKPVLTG